MSGRARPAGGARTYGRASGEEDRWYAVIDLITAFTRVAGVATALATTRGEGIFTLEDTLGIIETSLMESSIEHDRGEPGTAP